MRWSIVAALIMMGVPAGAWEKAGEDQKGILYRGDLGLGLSQRQSAGDLFVRLPDRTGQVVGYRIWRSDFAPAEWEGVAVFEGESVEGAKVNLVVGREKFFGQILEPTGVTYIDPHSPGLVRVVHGTPGLPPDFKCLSEPAEQMADEQPLQRQSQGHVIRTFRLAGACTAEFTQFHGSKEAALLSLTAALNRAHGIFERELGVRFQLVPEMANMVYENPQTDPYSTNEPGYELLRDAQNAFDAVIGNPNYDLGIVLTRGTFGLAYIRSVCDPERKGASCIGLPEPTGDAFHVNLVTHELGHQFGANHTFNSPTGFCLERRSAWTAFEPAAGSTIMSYGTLPCEGDNFVPRNDDYFHSESLKEMRDYLNSIQCGQSQPSGNRPPNVNAGPEFTIPALTPFKLTATGSDPDGDAVTFCWEQRDLGPAQTLLAPDNGESPLFRSYPPSANPTRVFPAIKYVLRNETPLFEELPSTDRMLRFRVTARDSQNNGSWSFSDTQVRVVKTSGPFRVTSHTGQETLSGSTEVRWDVAGTATAPISAANVRITLSTDGGATFNHVLAESTPNDGAHTVTLPQTQTDHARIMVEAVGKAFFNVNQGRLRIGADELRIVGFERTEAGLNIRWRSAAGKTYRVEKAGNLNTPQWQLAERITAAGNESRLTVGTSSDAGFFRIVEEQ